MPFSGEPTDYAVLTMREDEFEAVVSRLRGYKLLPGKSGRHYAVGEIKVGSASRRIAVARCRQGNLAAGLAAGEILEDLAPGFVFLCGIAGGVPSEEFGLGDVVLGTHLIDFTLSAAKASGETEYSQLSGLPEKTIESLLEILPAIRLTGWNTTGVKAERPQGWGAPIVFKGKRVEQQWLPGVTSALAAMQKRQRPVRISGPIASSDTLIKDPERLLPLLPANRHLYAVEMEAAGVLRALAQKHIPFLVVRGLSDVVGVKRLDAWTPYACATAASFLMALLKSAEVDRLIHPLAAHEELKQELPGQGSDAEITPALLTQKLDGMHEYEIDALINSFLERKPWKAVSRSPLGAKINSFVEWAQQEGGLGEAYARAQKPSP